MARMNSTSLYVTTNQIILRSDPNNPSTWRDLYRLAPYLRNSLCCVVCGNLLIDPQTPASGNCQHHLCRTCKGGRKRIKPACVWCKECRMYTENKTLRILLQCYKKMCIMLINNGIFRRLVEQASRSNLAFGEERGAGNLIMLIREGATFQDDYQMNVGLSKSVYSILPCVYTNSSTQTFQHAQTDRNRGMLINPNVSSAANGNTLRSVMYAGQGNNFTFKRNPKDLNSDNKMKNIQLKKDCNKGTIFKKPTDKVVLKSRRGCRCGNATATPGKLTCCGQRCPCYVESKPCIECKCRGCRNPHRPDGNKVRAHTPQMEFFQPITIDHQRQHVQLPRPQHVQLPRPQHVQLPRPQHVQLPRPQHVQLPRPQHVQLPRPQHVQLPRPQHVQLPRPQHVQLPRPQQIQMHKPLLQNVNVELEPGITLEHLNQQLMVANIKVLDSFTKISSSLPHAILVNDVDDSSDNEEEINVDM